jgi:hypothetical protein
MIVKAFIGLFDQLLVKSFFTRPRFTASDQQNGLTLRIEGKGCSPHTVIKLTEKQPEKLDKIREASPLIAIMHSLKEEFKHIFDTSKDLGTGMLGLIDWLKKAEPYYQKSVNTISV